MTLLRHRSTAVYAALVLATLVSWLLGSSHGAEGDAVDAATAIALAIAFVKVRFVGLEFMELRAADRRLRWTFEAWVLGVGAMVVALYLLA